MTGLESGQVMAGFITNTGLSADRNYCDCALSHVVYRCSQLKAPYLFPMVDVGDVHEPAGLGQRLVSEVELNLQQANHNKMVASNA